MGDKDREVFQLSLNGFVKVDFQGSRVTSDGVAFEGKKEGQIFEAKYEGISKLVYERTKKPRYSTGLLLAWPLLFTKEKQHYLTIEAEGAFAEPARRSEMQCLPRPRDVHRMLGE